MLYQLGYREVFRRKVINCTVLKIHDLSSRMFTFECALYFLGRVFPLFPLLVSAANQSNNQVNFFIFFLLLLIDNKASFVETSVDDNDSIVKALVT